jgi:hypothetical protein
MAALAELGWVEVIHRHKMINGEHWGTSNLWRFKIPDHLRAELHTAEDGRMYPVGRDGGAVRCGVCDVTGPHPAWAVTADRPPSTTPTGQASRNNPPTPLSDLARPHSVGAPDDALTRRPWWAAARSPTRTHMSPATDEDMSNQVVKTVDAMNQVRKTPATLRQSQTH